MIAGDYTSESARRQMIEGQLRRRGIRDKRVLRVMSEIPRERFVPEDLARSAYEDRGLLRPNREGQRRVYSSGDRVRLRLIMRGKRLGFSLDEIGEMRRGSSA